MGNFSGVIMILWFFVPLIFMGLDDYKIRAGTVQRLTDSLDCAGSPEWLGPEQDGTEKRCIVTLS